jgi:LysR family transcriptional regulator, regulator for bpeEF and oprC
MKGEWQQAIDQKTLTKDFLYGLPVCNNFRMRLTDRILGVEEFMTVAQAGSFVAASERLGLTPSGVGKAVQRLEERLGLRLFNRTTRRVALTQDGEIFLDRCHRLITDFDDAEAEIDARRSEIAGPIRINAPVAYGRLKIIPALAPFLKAHPEISLDLRLSDRIIDPVEERIDLLIRIGMLDDSGMWARKIDNIRFGVFAANTYLKDAPPLTATTDLSNHIRLGFTTNAGTPLPFKLRAGQDMMGFDPSRQFESTDIEGTMAMAIAAQGLAYLPTFLAEPACVTGALSPVLEPFWIDGPPVHLIHPQKRQLPKRIRVCADHIVGQFRQGRES